ncbi:Eco57I restriction-modification methylase domain-containing protein [Halobaculum gomorrense]|uniref:site-specific DNA-methyltransferase (adenine-specific) n=1 Tax=Halobaculum gomorrense TaxID=43928 RepID=A0A1M5MJQ8_9EURY|nr:N-6 DNA methylase [Halobaculum gomorrense]SHG77724.1 N-6 DNA Methylase [Halobaculum gomorrense]
MSQATLGPEPYRNSSLFSGYYLDERVADRDAWDCDEEAEAAFQALQTLWEDEKSLVGGYNESTLLSQWIDKVLRGLGHDTVEETPLPETNGRIDRVLFDSPETRREAMEMQQDGMYNATFARASSLLEAKQWDADFDEEFGVQRQYRDASHQVKYYLERTPDQLRWGILTNGRKWRLYGTKDYQTETYYEVDLPELLESGSLEQFKYFYVFFRPEAFHEISGTSFLDEVWNESETAAQELGEDLQDNVFTALRILGEGFVESNDLGINPKTGSDREEALEELKEQSLVLLYRLMFVLYAESRGLISPNDPGKRQEYDENFSLDVLRQEIVTQVEDEGKRFDEYSEYSTSMWSQLEDLFSLVDAGEEALSIPPYNGGLFDPDEHAYLTEYEVSNRYIAEVIYQVGTTDSESEDGRVPADYADLDTRHLGTIYEGLLEHEFRIAPEDYAAVAEDGGQVWKLSSEVDDDAIETVNEGELYVVNDDGERKATGAYYTPDYVVTYIVEETIDPLIEDIEQDLASRGIREGTERYVEAFIERVTDLTVLDPAMGSGHFLTKATGYLGNHVARRAREVDETTDVFDEQEVRRRVSRECIYGVDINGMAVELAKLSMWLETLAEEKPLAFLDHHLKDGNSLVGSDITEALSDDGGDEEDGQITLFQVAAQARQRTLEHVMDLMADLLATDNEQYEDIKSMEDLYEEIRDDPLYGRLFELANVHTAEQFGLDIPSDAYEGFEDVYEVMAGAIEDEGEWDELREGDWFKTAQTMAEEENFFHWELEYPEVFFGEDGERRSDAGFNAIVGNPPYIRIQSLREHTPKQASYFTEKYESATGNFDIYANFTEKGQQLLSDRGKLGYIEPHKFFQSDFGTGLRKYLSERNSLYEIVSFEHEQVFEGASVYTCMVFLTKSGQESFKYAEVKPEDLVGGGKPVFREIPAEYNESPWIFRDAETEAILRKIDQSGPNLEQVTDRIYQGLVTSGDSIYLLEKIEERNGDLITVRSQEDGEEWTVEAELLKPLLKGEDVHRYEPLDPKYFVIFPYKLTEEGGELVTNFVDEDTLRESYPRLYEYLKAHEAKIRARENGKMDREGWYDYVYPKNLTEFAEEKIVTPEISYGTNFTYDPDGLYHKTKVYGVKTEDDVIDEKYLLPIINTEVLWFFLKNTGYALRGGYFTFKTDYLNPFSIPLPPEKNTDSFDPSVFESHYDDFMNGSQVTEVFDRDYLLGHSGDILPLLAEEMIDLHSDLDSLNLFLLDHLGTYSDGPVISGIGLTQPPQNAADSILQETAEQKPNLRVGQVDVIRESDSTIQISLTARYKPDDEDAYETDQWGYTETESLPALRITDLTEMEADLIEHFVPVAVDEAGGFANFRETATKTNSLVDRLRALTLPDVDDVRDGLESYKETKARAEELEEQIERTDDLIDEIVYELYGLTDEEIAIVEEAVNE